LASLVLFVPGSRGGNEAVGRGDGLVRLNCC
jgi:hypothetical protein